MEDKNLHSTGINLDIPTGDNILKPIIKVMGVGGGGGNAVRHMYLTGITDVDFIVCNTDCQALSSNPVAVKIQLGEGFGAGGNPDIAREAALASEESVKAALVGTKMLFITTGMGGGTGTGASPIIASIAREMGILTVGIVTYPFWFEQANKFAIADEGIKELGQNVDALIVIKNDALKSYYGDLRLGQAFAKADDVLLQAAKSIAEIITVEGVINRDFNDVKSILENSGSAIINNYEAEGEDRATEAIQSALSCPLLENNMVHGAEKTLIYVSYSHEYEITLNELDTIMEILSNATCNMKEKFIWGHGYDDSLGKSLKVTLIASCLHNRAGEYYASSVLPKNEQKEPQLAPQPPVLQPSTAPQMPDIKENNTPSTKKSFLSNDDLRNKTPEEIEEYIKKSRGNISNSCASNFNNNQYSEAQVDTTGLKNSTSAYLNVLD
ncbi:MAG: cell division protein FtsZ [Bacteroidales bacterium]|jgi:cell division protein FtsZ|nr:cell division protein FtsZ [Bacteroidales bacterium]